MPPNPNRRGLHAYLSVDAHDAILAFAAENGVSVTSLLEVLAVDLAKKVADAGDATFVGQEWVTQARKIDAGRRRRN